MHHILLHWLFGPYLIMPSPEKINQHSLSHIIYALTHLHTLSLSMSTDGLCILNCIRRNWKDRFFVLKQDKMLCYYDTSDYHSAKPQKIIELSQVINLIDGGSKEHAFGIETTERTYHITAASSEEKR